MTELERERLIERIREDLHKQATYLTHHTIGLVIERYEQRKAKLV